MSSTNKTNYSYTKSEIDSMGGGASLSDTISQKADKSDLSKYFPKSGGPLSGTKISQNTNANHLEITGGTDYESGPSLVLTPNNSTEGWQPQGSFLLHTQNNHDLMGKPDGTLTWNGKQVATETDLNNYLPKSGGVLEGNQIIRNTRTDYLGICGADWGYGAHLFLTGKETVGYDGYNNGAWILSARNGTFASDLAGTPLGSLTWNNKPIDVIEEQGDGYIRYSNGIQICWGGGILNNNTEISYAKPFIAANSMSVQVNSGEIELVDYVGATNWEAAHFLLRMNTLQQAWVSWLAIGRWK